MSIYDKQNLREYKPVFNDDRDYTTNAPTYYDYMAEINTSVQKALEDIEGIVEGDIVDYIESDNHQLLEVTKKRVNGKHVGYTLTPKELDNNITTTDPGIEIVKEDNHTFVITTNKEVVKQYLVDGTGIYMTLYNGQYRLNVDFTKVQAKLTFQDGVKMSGNTVSADWNKVQKVLRPDNKSIIVDENGNISAQIPYDRLEGKIDKWRSVGNIAGSVFGLDTDVQVTTVNPAFLRKTGTYLYISRSKADQSVWGGKPDTPTGQPGFIRVTSSVYMNSVLQEFYPLVGRGYYFRVGGEYTRNDTHERSFWNDWRAVYNDFMYDRSQNKYTDQKGKMWGQGLLDDEFNYQAGSAPDKYGTWLSANDLSTIYKMTEKYTNTDKAIYDRIRFAYEPAQVAGDCQTGSSVYYKLSSVNTVEQEAHIVGHDINNGKAVMSFKINHPFFANEVTDMTVANDRIYFINSWRIFWFSLQDYSTGYIDFPHNGTNVKANGEASTFNHHLRYTGISYYNEKLYVLVTDDYRAIETDGNLSKEILQFAVWEVTLNTNGTGRVSDKCIMSNSLTGTDMHYLQVVNNNIYVGFSLDRLYNNSAQSAYGQATSKNKYDPCGIGVLTFSMRGLLYQQFENVKENLKITGLGHWYSTGYASADPSSYNADGCIEGFYDNLLVSGYQPNVYTGVFGIDPYVNRLISTTDWSHASRISYNSSGEVAVTQQWKDEDGKLITVDLGQRTQEAKNKPTPIVEE